MGEIMPIDKLVKSSLPGLSLLVLALWISGLYLFVSQKEKPRMKRRVLWPRLFCSLFVIMDIFQMGYSFYQYNILDDGTATYAPYCPSFLFFRIMNCPMLTLPLIAMQYNLGVFEEKQTLLSQSTWMKNYALSLAVYLVVSLIFVFPNILILIMFGIPDNPRSPTECFGEHIWALSIQSLALIFLSIYLRTKKTKKENLSWVTVEYDVAGFAGIVIFPFFYGIFFYEYYNEIPAFGGYFGRFTSFYLTILYSVINQIAIIWIPVVQNTTRASRRLKLLQERGANVSINDILEEAYLRDKFKVFIRSKAFRDPEVVELYLEMRKFTDNYNPQKKEELRNDFNSICHRYLVDTTEFFITEVNKQGILEFLGNGPLQIPPIVFEAALNEILIYFNELLVEWRQEREFLPVLADSEYVRVT